MAAIPTNVFLATGQYSVLPRMTTLLQTGRHQSHALSKEFLAKSKKLESIGIVGKTRIRAEVTRCSSSTKDDGHDPHEALASLESQLALAREELKCLVLDDADPSIINAREREERAADDVAEWRRTMKSFSGGNEAKQALDLFLVQAEERHFTEILHLQEVSSNHSDLAKVVRKMLEVLHFIIEHHKAELKIDGKIDGKVVKKMMEIIMAELIKIDGNIDVRKIMELLPSIIEHHKAELKIDGKIDGKVVRKVMEIIMAELIKIDGNIDVRKIMELLPSIMAEFKIDD